MVVIVTSTSSTAMKASMVKSCLADLRHETREVHYGVVISGVGKSVDVVGDDRVEEAMVSRIGKIYKSVVGKRRVAK